MYGSSYGWLCLLTNSYPVKANNNYRKYNNTTKQGVVLKLIITTWNLDLPSNKNILTFNLYIFRKIGGFQVFRGHLGGIFRHFYQKPPNRGQPPKIGGNVAGMHLWPNLEKTSNKTPEFQG